MDAKELRTDTALVERNEHNVNSLQDSAHLHRTERSKLFTEHGHSTMSKVEVPPTRPCAVIGPDRVIPTNPNHSVIHPTKSHTDVWVYPENVVRKVSDLPLKPGTEYHQYPSRNISPRQTFQENMQRIMVPPRINTARILEGPVNFSADKNASLPKTIKTNLPPDTKYCDVPYLVNAVSHEQRNRVSRNSELYVPPIASSGIPSPAHNWTTSGVLPIQSPRPAYGSSDVYRYPEYPSCAVPRNTRPHRIMHDEHSQVYSSDQLCHSGNIRYEPYPLPKERYSQARYEFLNNYGNPFPPPQFPPQKYDLQKPVGPPYVNYPLKYVETRMSETYVDGYHRPSHQLPGIGVSCRTENFPQKYSAPPGGNYMQNKLYQFPMESNMKSNSPTRISYDNVNKMCYDSAHIKPGPDNYFLNDTSRYPTKATFPMHNYAVGNTPAIPPYSMPYYRNENIPFKNYEYIHQYKMIDTNQNVNALGRVPPHYSPNIISPADSNTSNETILTQGTSQEDCGYVSQCSTTSGKSIDLTHSRLGNYEMHKRNDSRNYFHMGRSTQLPKIELNFRKSTTLKDKKDLDVRQFLQMWDEGDEESDENNMINVQDSLNSNLLEIKGSRDTIRNSNVTKGNQEQLYVLGLVNVPSEELGKYEHIQKVTKLPENIKGYNSIELLNQFEEVIASSNINNASMRSDNYERQAFKHCNLSRVTDPLPRPPSPLDVEAKISQSVIHKEVGCNFEIKPCSPKMINVEIAAPVRSLLEERSIEKVVNPLIIQSPFIISKSNDCDSLKRCEKRRSLNKETDIPSCKMLRTLHPSDTKIDSIKRNYNLQEYDSNSGVCLASLPRLDNDIELNFPEVNQQFINANKCEIFVMPNDSDTLVSDSTNTAKLDTQRPLDKNQTEGRLIDKKFAKIDNNLSFAVSPQPPVSPSGSDKILSKLSKYRKHKAANNDNNTMTSLDENCKTGFIYNPSVRTDSVIIKNPDNNDNTILTSSESHASSEMQADTFFDSQSFEPENNHIKNEKLEETQQFVMEGSSLNLSSPIKLKITHDEDEKCSLIKNTNNHLDLNSEGRTENMKCSDIPINIAINISLSTNESNMNFNSENKNKVSEIEIDKSDTSVQIKHLDNNKLNDVSHTILDSTHDNMSSYQQQQSHDNEKNDLSPNSTNPEMKTVEIKSKLTEMEKETNKDIKSYNETNKLNKYEINIPTKGTDSVLNKSEMENNTIITHEETLNTVSLNILKDNESICDNSENNLIHEKQDSHIPQAKIKTICTNDDKNATLGKSDNSALNTQTYGSTIGTLSSEKMIDVENCSEEKNEKLPNEDGGAECENICYLNTDAQMEIIHDENHLPNDNNKSSVYYRKTEVTELCVENKGDSQNSNNTNSTDVRSKTSCNEIKCYIADEKENFGIHDSNLCLPQNDCDVMKDNLREIHLVENYINSTTAKHCNNTVDEKQEFDNSTILPILENISSSDLSIRKKLTLKQPIEIEIKCNEEQDHFLSESLSYIQTADIDKNKEAKDTSSGNTSHMNTKTSDDELAEKKIICLKELHDPIIENKLLENFQNELIDNFHVLDHKAKNMPEIKEISPVIVSTIKDIFLYEPVDCNLISRDCEKNNSMEVSTLKQNMKTVEKGEHISYEDESNKIICDSENMASPTDRNSNNLVKKTVMGFVKPCISCESDLNCIPDEVSLFVKTKNTDCCPNKSNNDNKSLQFAFDKSKSFTNKDEDEENKDCHQNIELTMIESNNASNHNKANSETNCHDTDISKIDQHFNVDLQSKMGKSGNSIGRNGSLKQDMKTSVQINNYTLISNSTDIIEKCVEDPTISKHLVNNHYCDETMKLITDNSNSKNDSRTEHNLCTHKEEKKLNPNNITKADENITDSTKSRVSSPLCYKDVDEPSTNISPKQENCQVNLSYAFEVKTSLSNINADKSPINTTHSDQDIQFDNSDKSSNDLNNSHRHNTPSPINYHMDRKPKGNTNSCEDNPLINSDYEEISEISIKSNNKTPVLIKQDKSFVDTFKKNNSSCVQAMEIDIESRNYKEVNIATEALDNCSQITNCSVEANHMSKVDSCTNNPHSDDNLVNNFNSAEDINHDMEEIIQSSINITSKQGAGTSLEVNVFSENSNNINKTKPYLNNHYVSPTLISNYHCDQEAEPTTISTLAKQKESISFFTNCINKSLENMGNFNISNLKLKDEIHINKTSCRDSNIGSFEIPETNDVNMSACICPFDNQEFVDKNLNTLSCEEARVYDSDKNSEMDSVRNMVTEELVGTDSDTVKIETDNCGDNAKSSLLHSDLSKCPSTPTQDVQVTLRTKIQCRDCRDFNNKKEMENTSKQFEKCQRGTTKYKNLVISKNESLKRSLSDSALYSKTMNYLDKIEIPFRGVPTQFIFPRNYASKINSSSADLSDVHEKQFKNVQNSRRNSETSFHNEENMFCILIDNNCLISQENTLLEDSSTFNINNMQQSNEVLMTNICSKILNDDEEIVHNRVVVHVNADNDCEEMDSFTVTYPEQQNENNKYEEVWVDDVACIETVVSDDLDEANDNCNNYTISEFKEPTELDEQDVLENNENQLDVPVSLDFNCAKIKTIYGNHMRNNEIQLIESLYRTPHMSVNNKLTEKEPPDSQFFKTVNDIPEKVQEHNQYTVYNTDIENPCTDIENNISEYVDSSEVSSTTSEEKKSSILLKIRNYNGTKISLVENNPCLSIKGGLRCKFSEDHNFHSDDGRFLQTRTKPLITKAAQKYIPPINDFQEFKVKLRLPKHSLLKLKQLKITKEQPKQNMDSKMNTVNDERYIIKKNRPNFEDVLKSIDEIQYKMHKTKIKKVKEVVPKVVIKKNDLGSHYTTKSNKEIYNPDLTGRKWQPWVYLEKDFFIDKMALKGKTRAVFCHKRKSYILPYKVVKSQYIKNTIFITDSIESPKNPLKCTIKLK